MNVEERFVEWAEVALAHSSNAACAEPPPLFPPVGQIDNKVYMGANEEITFPNGKDEIGPVMKKLRETPRASKMAPWKDKHGWVCKIDVD